jgi:hypothetical protein
LDLYQKIASVPDPLPLLELSIQQAQKLKEASLWKSELDQLLKERSSLDLIPELEAANALLKQKCTHYESTVGFFYLKNLSMQ